MKRFLLLLPALFCLYVQLPAQTTAEEFAARYATLVKNLGYDGVGIETLLGKWEAAFPEDADMLCAKFNYYLTKCQSVEVTGKQQSRFLGGKPFLTLKDSLGVETNYFQEVFYDDSLFAMSSSAIDKAIKVAPADLELRFNKISALIGYEKESPDMASSTLRSLIDYNYTSHPQWKYLGESIDDEFFCTAIQEYCYTFFQMASPLSQEAFRTISEKMLAYEPSNTLFLTNMGTYNFIVAKNDKQAIKYYNKVLKAVPDDYTTIKNCVLLARNAKNVKLEKKYLPMLAKYGQDEVERASAQARLDALNKKK